METNSHLRFWENTKKIINNNFIGAFWNSNYTDFRSAFSIFCIWNRYNFVKDTKQKILILQNLLTALIALPTFNVLLLHENINFFDLSSNLQSLSNKNELKIEELDEITELGKILIYVNFYMKFIQESIQNSCILSELIYEYCFNTQGTTDFLIDFPKKTQKEKMIHRDFPRAQENADNETKRIITVRQLVAFYDHSWLNSNEPPDETTCKFWIAIDSLLTEEQSNKLSYIINADPNELTELERNLREQFF